MVALALSTLPADGWWSSGFVPMGWISVVDTPDVHVDHLRLVAGLRPFILDFPDDSVASAWRLRIFPENSSVSDDFLPK
jgi:hypothetical protein